MRKLTYGEGKANKRFRIEDGARWHAFEERLYILWCDELDDGGAPGRLARWASQIGKPSSKSELVEYRRLTGAVRESNYTYSFCTQRLDVLNKYLQSASKPSVAVLRHPSGELQPILLRVDATPLSKQSRHTWDEMLESVEDLCST